MNFGGLGGKRVPVPRSKSWKEVCNSGWAGGMREGVFGDADADASRRSNSGWAGGMREGVFGGADAE